MKVKILEVSADELRDALIKEEKTKDLPSMHDNWRFNFPTQLRKLQNAKAYVLVTEDTPAIIEGCMIFEMKDKVMPYLAFLEEAPHNKGVQKKFDHVAGCLIAYAFKLTSINAVKDYYENILFFDVLERTKEETRKLMSHYSSKYNARLFGGTRMVIVDEDGQNLVEKYLPQE